MRTLSERISDISLSALALRNVVLDRTDGVDATGARTRILALHLDAGLIDLTIGTQDTFRRARHGRIANVVVEAFADGPAVDHRAVGVLAARIRIAGIPGRFDDGWLPALDERISDEVTRTRTDRVVVGYFADGAHTAGAGTRVHALERDAGHVVRAVGAPFALRLASLGGQRISKEAVDAGADDLVVSVDRALRVGSTGGGVARIGRGDGR